MKCREWLVPLLITTTSAIVIVITGIDAGKMDRKLNVAVDSALEHREKLARDIIAKIDSACGDCDSVVIDSLATVAAGADTIGDTTKE